MSDIPLVFIESPYSGDIDRNVRYLLLCGFDSFQRGEMPTSSHGTMTMHPAKKDFFVSDYDPEWDVYTREEAISRANVLRHRCDKVVFYTDMGWSSGMQDGLEYCKKHNVAFELRELNMELILKIRTPLLTKELILDILKFDNYTRHFNGTPLLEDDCHKEVDWKNITIFVWIMVLVCLCFSLKY